MQEFKINNTNIKIFASEFDPKTPYSISNNVLDLFDEILLMPDTHVGVTVPIGFVGKFKNKIIPEIVGPDIGCGMMGYDIPKQDIDFKKLEEYINRNIPSGPTIHDKEKKFDFSKLSFNLKKQSNALKSIGTLGGGNHFIEIDEGKDCYTIVIHTGSRCFGGEVNNHHTKKLLFDEVKFNNDKNLIISKNKQSNNEKQISNELQKLYNKKHLYTQKYLKDNELNMYLNDIDLAQQYAYLNRLTILKEILKFLNIKLDTKKIVDMPHNYIDLENKVIHKGSIRAGLGDKLIIPLNMAEGTIFATGLGNDKWMSSGPHGAGRAMSRSEAKELVDMNDFKESMKGINSFSVTESTIDESPFAYKDANQVINDTLENIDIIEVRKPIYNFKAK